MSLPGSPCSLSSTSNWCLCAKCFHNTLYLSFKACVPIYNYTYMSGSNLSLNCQLHEGRDTLYFAHHCPPQCLVGPTHWTFVNEWVLHPPHRHQSPPEGQVLMYLIFIPGWRFFSHPWRSTTSLGWIRLSASWKGVVCFLFGLENTWVHGRVLSALTTVTHLQVRGAGAAAFRATGYFLGFEGSWDS